MSWTNLKATISAVIKANNKQEITGTILNSIFNSVINNLGANAQFAGIATPETPLVVQDGPTFWIAGQAGTYNIGGNAVKVGHATLAIFTWDCSTWDIGLMPISGVITVDNLIEAVQEATEEIRADLDALREQINSELQTYVNNGSYNRETKKIELKHSDTVLASIDATDFIVDGMVDDVRIENGNLVIDFNAASGKQDIEIPLTDIFNPSNYYTKVEVQGYVQGALRGYTTRGLFDATVASINATKANLASGLVPDAELPKADAAGTTAGIVRLRTNNQGVNRSGLTIASDGGMQVHVNNGLRIDGVGRLNANLEENGGLEFGSNNGIQMKTATDADVEEGTSTEKALTPSNMEKIKSEVTDSIMPDPAAGHEYVDLGLPSGTLWATMNVGASSPTDAGLYFSWGNTDGVAAEDAEQMTQDSYAGTAGAALTGDIAQGGVNDAARVNLGGSWVMPTKAQFEELIDDRYTTTEWVAQDGVNGMKITSKSNGKSIFLPAAGDVLDGSMEGVGDYGCCWSATFYNENNAYILYFDSGDVGVNGSERFFGYSVRPVLDSSITPSSKLHKVAVSGDYNDLENKPDLSAKADLTNGLVPDSELPKADAAGTTLGIVKLRTNGQGVNRSGLTVADGGLTVMTNNGLSIDGVGRLNANIHGAATSQEVQDGISTTKALTPGNMQEIADQMSGLITFRREDGNITFLFDIMSEYTIRNVDILSTGISSYTIDGIFEWAVYSNIALNTFTFNIANAFSDGLKASIYFTTGATPNISFVSQSSPALPIYIQEGFEFEANSEYKVSIENANNKIYIVAVKMEALA